MPSGSYRDANGTDNNNNNNNNKHKRHKTEDAIRTRADLTQRLGLEFHSEYSTAALVCTQCKQHSTVTAFWLRFICKFTLIYANKCTHSRNSH